MTTHSTTHETFVLERTYPAPPPKVFAAWSDPEAKVRWFSPSATDHTLDFRVGGQERNRGGGPADGPDLALESTYRDIAVEDHDPSGPGGRGVSSRRGRCRW